MFQIYTYFKNNFSCAFCYSGNFNLDKNFCFQNQYFGSDIEISVKAKNMMPIQLATLQLTTLQLVTFQLATLTTRHPRNSPPWQLATLPTRHPSNSPPLQLLTMAYMRENMSGSYTVVYGTNFFSFDTTLFLSKM
jgi:hypothetical protein